MVAFADGLVDSLCSCFSLFTPFTKSGRAKLYGSRQILQAAGMFGDVG